MAKTPLSFLSPVHLRKATYWKQMHLSSLLSHHYCLCVHVCVCVCERGKGRGGGGKPGSFKTIPPIMCRAVIMVWEKSRTRRNLSAFWKQISLLTIEPNCFLTHNKWTKCSGTSRLMHWTTNILYFITIVILYSHKNQSINELYTCN